ncbi:uracil-DNA glycosylase [Tomitella biformata]|uniref:uracil-DNA glycosylase n=1 Tax=Tomitella biformata TaxID=630403 RepID=UPI0004679F17|nr:uracil-DNA glycosylase [Tomitella biformata]
MAANLIPEDLTARIDPGWRTALAPVEEQIVEMSEFLAAEDAAGRGHLPATEHVLRAFERPLDQVRVLIVGQDPYPTPGHAVGLSFSVAPDVRPIPRSLTNIFREYRDDLGYPQPANGDLSPWSDAGVLLLNRVLSVRPGDAGSHRRRGWEAVTEQAIRALVAQDRPLVAILWGRDAEALTPMLGEIAIIASAHPSPLSASRGFFGSRPFSRTNELLLDRGGEPVDWRLPAEEPAQAGLWD